MLTHVLAAPLVHAINVGWVSRQSGSVQTRTVATALYNMCVRGGPWDGKCSFSLYRFCQLSAIAGVNVYAPNDAPLYRSGNLAMMILAICNVCLYGTWHTQQVRAESHTPPSAALAYFIYRLLNLRRERKWKSMSKVCAARPQRHA